MKLKWFFLGIVLTALPMSPETAQQADFICDDGANLGADASETRDRAATSIDETLARAYEGSRPRHVGAKIDPDPIFSEVSLEGIYLAYSRGGEGLTKTQVRDRFYMLCKQHVNNYGELRTLNWNEVQLANIMTRLVASTEISLATCASAHATQVSWISNSPDSAAFQQVGWPRVDTGKG